MDSEKISELITVANNLVDSKTGNSLNNVQKSILQQVLEGKKLKDIQVTGYSDSTVHRVFCPRLWELLSEATKEKVRINTIKLVLDKISNEQKYSSNRGEIAILNELPPVPLPIFPKRLRHNLPAASCTSFIGREQEITRLLGLLSPSHAAHLITGV